MEIKSHKAYPVFFGLIVLLFVSCGGMDSDARKAAELINKSIEQTGEMKLDDAQKSYRQAQEIMGKYKDHKQSGEFNKRYREYRDSGKLLLRNE